MTAQSRGDHVGEVLEQWRAQRPDLDVSPMAVIGRLSIASRLVDAELARTFAVHGLDAPSFDVLATLRRTGAPYQLTPTQLMRSAMITSGGISQRLDRLEGRGLVTRSPDQRDARGVLVTLTQRGREVIDRALPDHVATEQRLLGALAPADRTTLASLLHQLIESISSTQDSVAAAPQMQTSPDAALDMSLTTSPGAATSLSIDG